MRPFFIFILVISNFCLSAQSVTDTIINDILQVLRAKQVSALTGYIEAERHSNFIRWETLREVAGTNQEGVLKIEIVRKPDSTGSNVDNFKINLLADKDIIFFYELCKLTFKKKDDNNYDSYPVPVNAYKNLSAYQRFERLFTKTYHSSLDTSELFQTSIVYGGACGIAGTPTEYEQKLIAILKLKDVASLSAWLKSPNIEKQLYAIKGLYKLQDNGDYQISNEYKEIIDAITNKNGEAQTCGGCIYSSEPINALVKKMDTTSNFSFTNLKNGKHSIFVGLVLVIIGGGFIYYLRRQRTVAPFKNKC